MQKDIPAEKMLEIISLHENIKRETLAYNVRQAMQSLHLSEKEEYLWLAELCDTTRNTTYSWFAPHRDSKVPLKVLLKISIALKVPLYPLLTNEPIKPVNLRRSKFLRPSYEAAVRSYRKRHPTASIAETAKDLGIAEVTVRRHLKHMK